MATKFVRVKDADTNHEYTTTELVVKASGGKLHVLDDKQAVDSNGRPLPAKTSLTPPKTALKADAGKAGN